MNQDKEPGQGPDPDEPIEPDDQGSADESAGSNELSDLFAQLGLNLPGGMDLQGLFAQFQQAFVQMSTPGNASVSGVDWAQTKQATRQLVAQLGPDPTPSLADRRQIADAARLAELWLDSATGFTSTGAPAVAWSRAEWVEGTMDSWRTVVEPIVSAIANAMTTMLSDNAEDQDGIPGMAQLSQMLAPMLKRAAGSLYAMQLAEAIVKLAGVVVSGSDLGLQLLPSPRAVMLPTNVRAFGEGLEVSDEDVWIYLTLREAARQRLFDQVPWLAPQILALLEHYAREIRIDASAIRDAMELPTPENFTPERLEEASKQLQGRLFEPTQTAEQKQILGRLETLLALVEGWVDVVTRQAAGPWLRDENALSEAVRRRRAAGGPVEKLFQTLVGLQIRPRRLRDAANLWSALTGARGSTGRDQVWAHPDLIPTAADLDDPLGFVNGDNGGHPTDDIDDALQRLLEEYRQGDSDQPTSQ